MPTLAQLFTGLTGHTTAPNTTSAAVITPWVMNSALVQPGGAFVARPGEKADGHTYIPDALARGASVIIAERARLNATLPITVQIVDVANPQVESLQTPVLFLVEDSMAAMQGLGAWWRNQANPNLRVIGITGSVGKTTTKELVAKVLSQRYKVWKSKGNYNSDIGLPLTLMDMPLDTERAVMEMGMTRLGEITELAAMVRPDVGVVTNVGIAHAEQLGSIEAIAHAKGELPANLPPQGLAILNGDDPRVMEMAQMTKAKVFTFGMDAAFDLWADQITSNGLKGLSFIFRHGKEEIFARVGLLGRHSVHGALAAAAVALNDGMSWQEILVSLSHMDDLEVLRVIVVQGVNGSTLIDDSYNASPDSVMAALNLLADLDGRKIAVLGDMRELGDYAERAHTMIARRAAEVAQRLVVIGSMAPLMANEAIVAGMSADAIYATPERSVAVEWLKTELQAGDVVLVKGSRALRLDELVNELSVSGNGDGL
jgi:UDP-N-acetylmuramoyl-tripeptide--D-alanyl-D-alanine ligase